MSPMPADAVTDVVPATATTPDAIAHERCDRCGARAHVVTVQAEGLPLAWCSHHFRRYQPALTAAAGVVIAHDTRHQLVPTPRTRA